MKLTLVLLQTLDGYIAKDLTDDLSWGSSDDKKFFKEISISKGTMIMGHNTYKSMPSFAFKDRYTLVFTRNPGELVQRDNVDFFEGSPQEALKYLEEKGKTQAVIAGGAEIYSMFLNSKLVDEIYVTIAPLIFGTGIKAYKLDSQLNLQLIESIKLNNQEVVLHYLVNK